MCCSPLLSISLVAVFGFPNMLSSRKDLLLCCGKAKEGFLSHLWGRPEFLHFDRSLFAFLVCPYMLPVSSHVHLLLSAEEGTLSPAMSLQHLAHKVSSLQQGPKPLQWPQIFS